MGKLKKGATLDEIELAATIGRKKRHIRRLMLQWARVHLRDYPWRRAGADAYQILIAELLLKRTTAAAAARVYESFVAKYSTVGEIADASPGALEIDLKAIGLHRQRARGFSAMAAHIKADEAGRIPASLDRLLAIPGLGDYSARAVLSFGFDRAAAIVDSNVERVLKRVFGSVLPPRPARGVIQSIADGVLPRSQHRQFNFALLDHAADICRYRDPRCSDCQLRSICDFGRGLVKSPHISEDGRLLRKRRQSRRLSLVELSRRARVSKLTIINIEAGRTQPRADTLERLRRAMEASGT